MRYGELIRFEPLESVIQLRRADDEIEARRLVETYIVSDAMADQLINVVVPQLQLDRPHDNKGLLVVGNYGTGKSHLMSVLSAVAEYSGLADALTHGELRSAAKQIEGRFKVLRLEIGAVTGSLRDMLLRELGSALARWGTPFVFPPADQVTNNKDALIAAMAAFQEKYPGQGILLLVDEMLEHLERRHDQELILDLGFMRELGEVAALTPFRFMAGLQEMLFDNPKFRFAAGRLHRVRERFEQVRIAREDLEFVVANRLLRKTDAQIAWITEHLRKFVPLYGGMGEHIDRFARLFPMHPSYISTFESVRVAEKRMVLKSFSNAIRDRLDKDVPVDSPGLVSYDHYWGQLKNDPSLRNLENVKEIVDKSTVLEGRIKAGYTRKALQPMAVRIIHALSVQRLTTSDINVPLGATAEELRDGLCLLVPMPEATADFLLGQVQVALEQIMRTVSGQYISYNEVNGQYYLDIKKDIDFDALIAERGDFMGPNELNRYFNDALQQVLNQPDSTYVPTNKIWQYQLPWAEHKVTRPGYLCFSQPNLRSTAQPQRDFYIYILPPFQTTGELPFDIDSSGEDEVILNMASVPPELQRLLRTYAGARAQGESPTYRDIYLQKADDALRPLVRWLRENLRTQLSVSHQGVEESVDRLLLRLRANPTDVEEMVRTVAAHYLTPHFEERYPEYPVFKRLSALVTEESRENTAMEAIRFLSGRGRTTLATSVLDGLGLLDDEGVVRPDRSRYARDFLKVLTRKPEGQVVNRGEVIQIVQQWIQPVEKDVLFRLEPEWVVVVLLALVYSGDIVLNIDGQAMLDAGTIDRAVTTPLRTLTDFRVYGRPRTLPLGTWVTIFEGMGLQSALIRDEATRRQGLEKLQEKVQSELDRVASIEAKLQQELSLWHMPIFTDRLTFVSQNGWVVGSEKPEVRLRSIDMLLHVRQYKQFLDELSRLNTEGKLRNLRLSVTDVSEAIDSRKVVDRAAEFLDLVAQLQPLATYLAGAEGNLPPDNQWSRTALSEKSRLLDDVRRLGQGELGRAPSELRAALEELKRGYMAVYSEQHRRFVLGQQADDRRRRLKSDARLQALKTLSQIELLPQAELGGWEIQLIELRTCREYHEGAITDAPTCPFCQLRPAQIGVRVDAEQMLHQLDAKLDILLCQWRQGLKTNLATELAKRSIEAMSPSERQPIEQFLVQKDDDTHIPSGFVDAATKALQGIDALTVPATALIEALKNGGLPCTVDDLKDRFTTFLSETLHGHNPTSTRLTLSE